MKTIRIKAYSLNNPDGDSVKIENRLRGCKVGDPFIVFGDTVLQSKNNLHDYINDLEESEGTVTIVSRSFDSAVLEVDDFRYEVMLQEAKGKSCR
jgi:hypothetical protein